MSTPEAAWSPAVVPDLPDQADAPVRFGAAAGNEIPMPIAQAIVGLWYERARANVGTALTAPEVAELLLPLLTPEVLSLMLTAWRDRQPALFAAYLGEAFTGTRPSRTRASKAV
jgi:hypothetical protein